MILFGGSFDPVQLGHLSVIRHVSNKLNERITALPCTANPLKRRRPVASPEDRVKMLELCRLRHDIFDLCDVEIARGFAYTYQTIRHFTRSRRSRMVIWVCGADSFNSLHLWKNIDYIKPLVRFCVVKRLGEQITNTAGVDYTILEMPTVNISSTAVRDRIKRGLSINGLVTKEVECYIQNFGLYRG